MFTPNNRLNVFKSLILGSYKKAKRTDKSGSWVGDSANILCVGDNQYAVMFPSVIDEEHGREILQNVLEYTAKGHLELKDHTKGVYVETNPDYWPNTNPPLQGCVYLSHSNHPVGHPNSPSLPTLSLVGGCANFGDGIALLDRLSLLSEFANQIILTVDKNVHAKMVMLRQKMMTSSPHVKAICSVSPALHSTLGIIVNRQSGRHRDNTDARGSWAVMFVLGDFEGGEIELELQGMKITSRFRSGDAIVLQAGLVEHAIQAFKGTLRVTIVYFTKDSVWREYGANC